MDDIEEADSDIDNVKLLFIGSNNKIFNFNIFRKPLKFISAIYNDEISLKKANFKQRALEKKIEELEFNYKPKNEKEKEEIELVLMQAKDLVKYRDEIIEAIKDGTFLSKHLKKSDHGAYDYVLKDVNKSIKELKSMEEKINLSLFREFFESSPVDYAKDLINSKNADES